MTTEYSVCYETRIAMFTEGKREPTEIEQQYARQEAEETVLKINEENDCKKPNPGIR